ncbi:MAG: hypothetical protein HKP58_14250 [Desulfatitalea sp.]|nr:PspA/IM30 family protein [Desulfatitalea sp.]NNK01566.1 hypothetical protein [Desulfatitalea sp.]
MGIMTRIIRLWKADVHGVMDQLEDKSLLLKQCLREMESSLKQKQSHLEHVRRTSEQLRNDLAARGKEQDRLETDLALAVRKEKDDIAKLLIRKQFALKTDADRLDRQLVQLEEEHNRLSHLLQQQQSQYDQLKIKTAAYHRQAEQQAANPMDDLTYESTSAQAPTEEEVELELLRYKETAAQGGAA